MLDGRITLRLWSLPSEQGKRRWKLCQFKANYYHNFRFEPWRLISPFLNKRFLVQQTLQISVLSRMSLPEQEKLCISSGIRERWIRPTKTWEMLGFHNGFCWSSSPLLYFALSTGIYWQTFRRIIAVLSVVSGSPRNVFE